MEYAEFVDAHLAIRPSVGYPGNRKFQIPEEKQHEDRSELVSVLSSE